MLEGSRSFRQSFTSNWLVVAALAALLAVAAYLRIHDLTATSIWLDEAVSINQSSGTIGELIAKTASDNYPPLHNLLLFGSIKLLGNTEVAARLPSVVLSLLDITFVFLFARRCGFWAAGLVAVALVCSSAFHLWYAQEARMYALLSFSSTWFAWASLGFILRPTWQKGGVALLASLVLVYSHPFGLINWGAIGLGGGCAAFIWASDRWRTALKYGLVGVATVLLYIPWGLIILRRAESINAAGFWIPYPDWTYLRTEIPSLFAGDTGFFVVGACALTLLAAPFLKPTIKSSDKIEAQAFPIGVTMLIGWLILPLCIALIASYLFQPVVLSRYLIASVPAFSLLAGLGLARLSDSKAYIAALVISALGLGFYGMTQFHPRREDWRAAAAHLNATVADSDCVITYPWFTQDPLTYYYRSPPACFVAQPFNDATLPENLNGKRIHLVSFMATGTADVLLPALLEAGYSSHEALEFSGVRVETLDFAQVPTQPAPASSTAGPFSVSVEVWGQSYLETPTFEIIADGTVVGRGTTAADARENADAFSFDISVSDPQTIQIALTNDNFESPTQDVNLYVKSLKIGDRAVDLSAIDLGGTQWTQYIPDIGIVIGTNDERLVVPRPANGWN